MSVKRNDPCPCGSGKKYKKCCLKNEAVVQVQEVKEERFFQTKQTLVLQVKEFLNKQVSPTEYYQLQSEFKKRTNYKLDDRLVKGFFQYWLNFFHRFENGLRGIEWFVKEATSRLSEDEKQLANTWQTLQPKIVQAVHLEDRVITFKDVCSDETFKVPHVKDNVTTFLPWYSTITLLEPFQDFYYFNGVRIFEGPDGAVRAIKKVKELAEETHLNEQQILIDYYPEILVELLYDKDKDPQKERSIVESILQYQIENEQPLLDFLQSQRHFEIDEWQEEKKQISWIDVWYQYADSEIAEPVFLAEVFGKIFIEKDRLKFNGLDEKRVNEFKEMIQQLLDENVLTFLEESTHSFTIPFHAEIRDIMVTIDKDTPKYFALYAQNDQRFEFERPLRQYNGLSLKELIEAGRLKDADHMLKQLEYNLYLQVQKQYGQVVATADFNSLRRELGLPLSPFVTGGENRASSLEVVTAEQPMIDSEDIACYEQLGFTPETAQAFYTEDIIRFYKEKTDGKSENTVRKYRSSLADLRTILEQSTVTGWSECSEEFWEQVMNKDFPELYETLTKTAIKDFTSTIKALVKWLDKQGCLEPVPLP